MTESELVVRRAIDGPVIRETQSEAYAVRVAGLDQPGMLEQWWDMGREGLLPFRRQHHRDRRR